MDNQNSGEPVPPIEPKAPNALPLNKGLIIGLSAGVVILLAAVIYLSSSKPANGPEGVGNNPTNQNQQAQNQDKTADSAESGVEGWKAYRNEEFGFEIQFTGAWKGYKTTFDDGSQGDGGSQVLRFYLPTKDAKYGGGLEGFANPLTIVIYIKSAWRAVLDDSPHPAYIAEKGNYVFAYGVWQDPPLDLIGQNFEIEKVISTFKFTN